MKVRKLLAGILSAAMVLGTVAVPAFADDNSVAKIGSVFYETLAAAIAAAKNGDTVTLLKDCTSTEEIEIKTNITLDFNNHKVETNSNVVETEDRAAFRILADVTVTDSSVEGIGGVDTRRVYNRSDEDDKTLYAFKVGKNDASGKPETLGALVINGGVYDGDCSVVSVTYGAAYINDGIFSAEPWNGSYQYTLNCVDDAYKAGLAKIVVTGGTFYEFDPASNAAEGEKTDFVAAGFLSYPLNQTVDGEPNGEHSYVVSAKDMNSVEVISKGSTSGKCYNTIEEAFELADIKDGDTIKLHGDTTVTKKIAIDKDITIELYGSDVYYAGVEQGGIFEIYADVTVKDYLGYGMIITNDGLPRNNTAYVFRVGDMDNAKKYGRLTVTSGGFIGDCSALYVERGVAYIKGDCSFGAEPWTNEPADRDHYRYTLNCKDKMYKAGLADIVVIGGGFANFDPSKSTSENPNASFVPNGYTVKTTKVDSSQEGYGITITSVSQVSEGTANVATVSWTEYSGDEDNETEETKTESFNTLAKAVECANGHSDDVEIILSADAVVTEELTLTGYCKLDLNGHTLTSAASLQNAAFRILGDVEVVDIAGGGKIDTSNGVASDPTPYVFTVGNKAGEEGTLTIKSGSYKGDCTTVYVVKGTANINGGNFDVEPWTVDDGNNDHYRYMLNCLDANYKDGSAKIVVTGGTFNKFNPANNKAEGANTNFVSAGYVSTAKGDSFEVAKDALVAIGDVKYATFEEAINEASDGDTITLLKDYTVGNQIGVTSDITIDFNGKKITTETGHGDAPAFRICADVTVKNGNFDTSDGVAANDTRYPFIVGYRTAEEGEEGTLTIESGIYKGDCTAVSVNRGTAYIKGGTFEVEPWTDSVMTNDYRYTLNCYGANKENGTATIVVTGGTFKKFDPANNKADGNGTNYVAEGYEVLVEGADTYIVDKEKNTLVDSGWYYSNSEKRGVIRFSFKFNPTNEFGEIVKAGIKYVNTKDGNVEESTVEGTTNTTTGSFYGDIKNIEENSTAKYFAKAYIENANGEKIWADELLEGSVNWSREFTGYKG